MRLTNQGFSVRLANSQEYVDPATVAVIEESGPNTITFIAPYDQANPPFYDVGFILPSGDSQRRRLNHNELRLMFRQGFKVLKAVLPSLQEFFAGEKRLMNRQKLRALTYTHPLSPHHATTPIPGVTPLQPHEMPPPDQFENPL